MILQQPLEPIAVGIVQRWTRTGGPGRGPGLDSSIGSSFASVLVRAEHLAQRPRPERAIGLRVDALLDELDRAVGEGEVRAAGVEAAEGPLAQVQAGRHIDPVR